MKRLMPVFLTYEAPGKQAFRFHYVTAPALPLPARSCVSRHTPVHQTYTSKVSTMRVRHSGHCGGCPAASAPPRRAFVHSAHDTTCLQGSMTVVFGADRHTTQVALPLLALASSARAEEGGEDASAASPLGLGRERGADSLTADWSSASSAVSMAAAFAAACAAAAACTASARRRPSSARARPTRSCMSSALGSAPAPTAVESGIVADAAVLAAADVDADVDGDAD